MVFGVTLLCIFGTPFFAYLPSELYLLFRMDFLGRFLLRGFFGLFSFFSRTIMVFDIYRQSCTWLFCVVILCSFLFSWLFWVVFFFCGYFGCFLFFHGQLWFLM